MAVNLSPVGGVAAQFFNSTGNAVLSGGKLYTYAAGTTTPAVTYTTSNGATAWTNPVVLDASGRVSGSGEIWLTDGIIYKFVLKDSNDVLIATYDNITGINSNAISYTNQQEIVTATAGQTVFNLGISYQPATNSLSVFVDGVNQYGPGAQYSYVETDSTTVTFNDGLHVGAEVKFTTTQQQGAGAVDASQVTYDPPFTGSVATNVEAKLAQTVSVKDFGAIGDGVADDTTAIQNAINSGANLTAVSNETYLIQNTLVFGSAIYDFQNATVLAGASCTGSMFSVSSQQETQIKNVYLNGNSNAIHGLYAFHVNGPLARFDNIKIQNCTGSGFNMQGCQLTTGKNLQSLYNGSYGYLMESCNVFTLDACEANANGLGGIYIAKGGDGFSSGMNIINCTMQFNNGNGIHLQDNSTPVHITNSWFEGNNGHCVYANAPAVVQDNLIAGGGYVFDIATDSYTTTPLTGKYAIYVTTNGRGVFTNNQLPTSSGFDGAHVYFDNTGLSDDWYNLGVYIQPNFTGVANVPTTLVLAETPTLQVITQNYLYYHAVKKINVSDTTSYTVVLEAAYQSSVEINIYAIDDNAGTQGQSIFKTWTSADVDTRNSFAEIGGVTNPFVNGVFYNPVYLAGHGLYVRWNGNNLEIKPVNQYDNRWIVEVKAYVSSTAFYPTWVI